MKIVHAVANEVGTGTGGQLGDQTGKEIRVAEWYRRPWEMYIEPVDRNLGRRAAEIAKLIAAGNFGYDRVNRWSGLRSIQNFGTEKGSGDFDCSSLCIACYKLAGLDIAASGYTGSLEKIFKAQGFKVYKDPAHLDTPQAAVAGGMFCTPNAHVVICVEDGQGAVPSEPVVDAVESSERRIMALGSVWLHSTPDKLSTSRKRVVRKGEILTVIGEAEGMFETAEGWISSNDKYMREL